MTEPPERQAALPEPLVHEPASPVYVRDVPEEIAPEPAPLQVALNPAVRLAERVQVHKLDGERVELPVRFAASTWSSRSPPSPVKTQGRDIARPSGKATPDERLAQTPCRRRAQLRPGSGSGSSASLTPCSSPAPLCTTRPHAPVVGHQHDVSGRVRLRHPVNLDRRLGHEPDRLELRGEPSERAP